MGFSADSLQKGLVNELVEPAQLTSLTRCVATSF
jgi:hypothetical protein